MSDKKETEAAPAAPASERSPIFTRENMKKVGLAVAIGAGKALVVAAIAVPAAIVTTKVVMNNASTAGAAVEETVNALRSYLG